MNKRIQRRRSKGWHMPANAVYVGRPSRWGNPYKLASEFMRRAVLVDYEKWVREILAYHPGFLDPLRGRDLACWCPLDKPCHADVLLKLIAETEPEFHQCCRHRLDCHERNETKVGAHKHRGMNPYEFHTKLLLERRFMDAFLTSRINVKKNTRRWRSHRWLGGNGCE